MPEVKRLGEQDADAVVAFRRQALEQAPLAFGSSLDDDRLSIEFARSILENVTEQAVFGAFDGEDLAGIVGLIRQGKVKQRHRGFVWGMFVESKARNQGVGRALLDATIERARGWGLDQVHLSVTEAAPAARHLYESSGFRLWGTEPRSLGWEGRFVDEHHFVLDLRD